MQFTKMHGAGNDFVVVDVLRSDAQRSDAEWSQLAVEVCDRHFGVGADGLLLLAPSAHADMRMRIFNPDGSEAESCGNGIRCLGRYYRDHHAPDAAQISVQTLGGPAAIWVRDDGSVTVDMGPPNFRSADIPVKADGPEAMDLPVEVDGAPLTLSCVSMGNPHAVTFVEPGTVEGYPLERIGPQVEQHGSFPHRTNFEVAEVLDRAHARVRVWERGAGLTLACGTGACATVATAHRRGLVGDRVDVTLPGGTLTIEWSGVGNVLMTGPAEYAFSGEYVASSSPLPRGEAGRRPAGPMPGEGVPVGAPV